MISGTTESVKLKISGPFMKEVVEERPFALIVLRF